MTSLYDGTGYHPLWYDITLWWYWLPPSVIWHHAMMVLAITLCDMASYYDGIGYHLLWYGITLWWYWLPPSVIWHHYMMVLATTICDMTSYYDGTGHHLCDMASYYDGTGYHPLWYGITIWWYWLPPSVIWHRIMMILATTLCYMASYYDCTGYHILWYDTTLSWYWLQGMFFLYCHAKRYCILSWQTDIICCHVKRASYMAIPSLCL